jgi:glycosyltransferase involved in cell wall biosynthesis
MTSTTVTKRLLFISPVMPASSGNGLAMRSGVFLQAYAQDWDVSLRVVPIADPHCKDRVSSFAASYALDASIIPVARPADGEPSELPLLALGAVAGNTIENTAASIKGKHFDAVHIERTYMAPLALRALAAAGSSVSGPVVLDIDDDEGETARRLASMYFAKSRPDLALAYSREAGLHDSLEQQLLSEVDLAFVCSDSDAQTYRERTTRSVIAVVPNTAMAPRAKPPQRQSNPPSLLFVGTLGYEPNRDAALYLADEVLPRLHRTVGDKLELVIVGADPPEEIAALEARSDVKVTGYVDDLSPYYAACSAVVVPLRAGGGTRIKVLEAFAHRRPVVSTSIGCEGIAANHKEHLLISDDAEGFAACCAQVVADKKLSDSLIDAAERLYLQHYERATVIERIQHIVDEAGCAGHKFRR